jgi:chemotaxis protein methyltransferase CheR
MTTPHLNDDHLELILGDLLELHAHDFTGYSRPSLKRRVARLLAHDRFTTIAELRGRLREDKEYLDRFVEEITVNVTEMFRDPAFYRALREKVLPDLAALPAINIWHAGCSTGEEVYSMAIMLHEAGLLERSTLHATDINATVLDKVRRGLFPIALMAQYRENYILSGGKKDFSSYYTKQYHFARFGGAFASKIRLKTHNLVSESSFNRFHLTLCRNVLIYFDKALQNKVLQLFHESLEPQGFLGLGAKETLRFTEVERMFGHVEGREKIWRRK